MEKKGSWQLFFITLGLLFIMISPQAENPGVMITGGLAIVIISVIQWWKAVKKDKENHKKW